MKVVVLLWLINSNYAEPVGRYHDILSCVRVAVQVAKSIPERHTLMTAICIPTMEETDSILREAGEKLATNHFSLE